MDGLAVAFDALADHVGTHVDHTLLSPAAILALLYNLLSHETEGDVTVAVDILMPVHLID